MRNHHNLGEAIKINPSPDKITHAKRDRRDQKEKNKIERKKE